MDRVKLSSVEAMQLAIGEAKKGFGFVSPNPPVGCVILDREGYLLSKGYHHQCGAAHAEIDALSNLTSLDLLNGAHLYVTLEPCAHEGRTPSCAKHLVKLPLASVTFGLIDPNPMVSGQGVEILKTQLRVHQLLELEDELRELMEIYFLNMKEQIPFVALKIATTLDGMMATRNHRGRQISGTKSMRMNHLLRGFYDAILIGRKTYESDNPFLNIRHPRFPSKSNKVVILDPEGKSLDTLKSSNITSCHHKEDVIVVLDPKSYGERQGSAPFHLICASKREGGTLNLRELLRQLFRLGVCSLFVEGGSHTLSAFLNERLFHRLYLFQASKILGGVNGLSWTEKLLVEDLNQTIELDHLKFRRLDQDLFLTAVPKEP